MSSSERIRIGPEVLDPAVSRRKILCLDMNVWIDLAEGHSEEATTCCEMIGKLVAAGAVICPLAPPVLWELHKQKLDSALRVARTMDRLSLSVSFAPSDEIHTMEVWYLLRNLLSGKNESMPRRFVLVPVVSYLSSESALEFTDSWSIERRRHVTRDLRDALRKLTISDLVRMAQETLPVPEIQAPAFSEAVQRRAEDARGNKNKAWQAEAASVLRSTILPKLNALRSTLPPAEQLKALDRISELAADKFGSGIVALLQRMPALSVQVEVMTATGFDIRRKDSANDFYDYELLGASYTYSDLFVSRDRHIRHILERPPIKMSSWPTPHVSGLDDLRRHLEALT